MEKEQKEINGETKELVDISKLGATKVIDLVVPMHKAKHTLMRLLASVTMQSMRQNVHIILVQDADNEDYSELLSIFSQMLDIEVVVLKENAGPGKARRLGMKYGTSKYITCMDADDTFQNPFALQELYTAIEENELDAVNSLFLEQVGVNKFITHENDWVWMFGKIYRRKFLEDNEIEMNDSRANEDTGFNTVVRNVGKIGYLPDITYIWHYKEDSITRINDGIYRFTGIEGWLYNMEWAMEQLTRLKVEEEKIKREVAGFMVNIYTWYLEYYRDTDKRVDINVYLEWVDKFIVNCYNVHTPNTEQLLDAYKERSKNFNLTEFIPIITLFDFIGMVGGEKCKIINT